MQQDSSYDELDSQNQDDLCKVTNEDIYDDYDGESSDQQPENLEIQKNRRNTGDIESNCQNVNSYVIKISQIKRTSTANPIKKLVSKKKNRFSLDGFNLDLTYITDQLIAMGYPAEDYEQFFRNSMSDVQRFFRQRHAGHYRIFNLCAERKYKHSCFEDQVSEYPFEDHQAPKFQMIYHLCQELENWLKKDSKNVAAIHCKAGKGRTGIMICCYLLYSGMFKNSYEAMRYYGSMRTNNKKGLTIPSQIRYVMYFEKALANKWTIQTVPKIYIQLVRIKLVTIPNFNFAGLCDPWFTVINNELIYTQELEPDKKITTSDAFIDFMLNLVVCDDVRIIFYHKSMMNKKMRMFQFWFNTSFFDPNGKLIIDKYMLDDAHKDVSDKKFSKNFRVEIDGIEINEGKIILEKNGIQQFQTSNNNLNQQTQKQQQKL